jgi:hypothetical protein
VCVPQHTAEAFSFSLLLDNDISKRAKEGSLLLLDVSGGDVVSESKKSLCHTHAYGKRQRHEMHY